ncbi:hypothetical protein V1477_010684 [Vespula maculifrons]|uniref:Uncharacterized protein n=1 Tax=Vespula maculifrons TaxID=7453 RepID=A0ABD2C2Q4_VESMC
MICLIELKGADLPKRFALRNNIRNVFGKDVTTYDAVSNVMIFLRMRVEPVHYIWHHCRVQ